ncbi:MAG: phospho-N-acetylmuramoyl-pentapeptide-transferase [Firmicutes bacterium]|nr:phospho-N-acetylmuramoyl-pentapeptide-transferase [Bacillota bacterium]
MLSTVPKVILLSLIISVVVCPLYIYYAKRRQFRQNVREDGPQRHLSKTGTPTMGGIVFLVAATISLFIVQPRSGPLIHVCLLMVIGNAAIGFLDDYGKVVRGQSLGLKARTKLTGQFLVAALLIIYLYQTGHPTTLEIPFTCISLETGWFYPFVVLVMVMGATNAANLTDGIDGLAAGTSIIALMAFLIIASMRGLPEIALFCGAMIGATFGFLIFNLHPARLFMGDVGSLALGGSLAVVAILTKCELHLIIIGAVFVIETLSVAMQVLWFRLGGRRVFLMSPLHHHYELKGYSEWQVVMGFWGLSFIFALVGLMGAGKIYF